LIALQLIIYYSVTQQCVANWFI